ncbi:MAG: SocA family protein [Leadbetterella sp.]|nr:SocA family protein [Leadbetterella sp.]
MAQKNIDFDKAKAAVLYIVSELGKADFTKVFKILFFAEKKHLAKYGRMIVGDSFIKMEYGPVPSKLYDLFKAGRDNSSSSKSTKEFLSAFNVVGYTVDSKERPDLDELSKSDIECLDESINENKKLPFKGISEKSHGLAWASATLNGRIDYIDIAKEGGATEDMIEYIKEFNENLNLEIV